MNETEAKAEDALIPSVCLLLSLSDLGIRECDSGAGVLIATPRLFECFETPAPRGRIRGVRVEVRIKQMGEETGRWRSGGGFIWRPCHSGKTGRSRLGPSVPGASVEEEEEEEEAPGKGRG